ncbi:MAG TPA: DUF5362 family protein [Puia sp.]|nr:DUF5362 family protein [Puia sp.]
MAETTPNHLFELSLDRESIDNLTETARWGKFLAILGFITIGLLVIFSFFIGAIFANLSALSPYPGTDTGAASSTLGVFLTVIYLIVAVIYFFPCLYLFRYSVRMKAALNTNDQTKLNQSLKSQKMLYRYVGIVTIIAISLELIFLLIGGVAKLFLPH